MYPLFAFCNDPAGTEASSAWVLPGTEVAPRLFVSTLVLSSHYQPLLGLTVTPKAQILLLEGRDTGTVSFISLGTALN